MSRNVRLRRNVHRQMSMHVFHYHNRVIHQNPDGENQGEQRHAIERKAPRPRSKQRRHQGQGDRRANNRRFTSTERKVHQRHHGERGENQLLNQFHRFVVRGRAIVARLSDRHVRRNHGVVQLFDAAHDLIGHINCICAWLFRDAHGDGGVFAECRIRHIRVIRRLSVPHIMRRRRRTIAHIRHVAQIHGVTVGNTDNQLGDILCIAQMRAGFDIHRLLTAQQISNRRPHIGRLQSAAHRVHIHAATGHARRIQLDHHRAPGAADGFHLARPIHSLEFGFQTVCDPLQFMHIGLRIFAVQG